MSARAAMLKAQLRAIRAINLAVVRTYPRTRIDTWAEGKDDCLRTIEKRIEAMERQLARELHEDGDGPT